MRLALAITALLSAASAAAASGSETSPVSLHGKKKSSPSALTSEPWADDRPSKSKYNPKPLPLVVDEEGYEDPVVNITLGVARGDYDGEVYSHNQTNIFDAPPSVTGNKPLAPSAPAGLRGNSKNPTDTSNEPLIETKLDASKVAGLEEDNVEIMNEMNVIEESLQANKLPDASSFQFDELSAEVAGSPSAANGNKPSVVDYGKGNGNGGGGNPDNNGYGYDKMAKDIQASILNGEDVGNSQIGKLKQKYKQEKMKVNGKKLKFKDAMFKALEKHKGQGNVTKNDLLMDTIAEITDQELIDIIMLDINNGYSDVEDIVSLDPYANEADEVPYAKDNEDACEEDDDGTMCPGYEEDEVGGGRRRLGVTYGNVWPSGIIKYKVDLGNWNGHHYPGYTLWFDRVYPKMIELEELTGLKFQWMGWLYPGQSYIADGSVYIRETTYDECYTQTVGVPGPTEAPNLTLGPNCSSGNILHELLHVAGMMHQQSAKYRDQWVTVNLSNVQPKKVSNFDVLSNHGFEFVYDYGSIMHYGEYGFPIDRNKKTIDCRGHQCGQRAGLSYWDQWEIVYRYQYNFNFMNTDLEVCRGWEDGTLCAAGTTCTSCCNGYEYWESKAFTACGIEPCWGDGAICGAGTTCTSCCNGSEYWESKAFTACGTEPCWGGGALCGAGTTCTSCCNGYEWWWSRFPIGYYCK